MHFLLMYDVVDDYVERRTPFRAAHIRLAREAVARGELILGGAFANPADGLVLLFRRDSPAAVEAFVASICRQQSRQEVASPRMEHVVGRDAQVELPATI